MTRIHDQPGATTTAQERLQLADLLLKMGYAVYVGSEKKSGASGKSFTLRYVEFWERGKGND